MGIPSFFNYIIKSHYTIFKKLPSIEKVDNLYFDSNSIIYDCIRNNPRFKEETNTDYEYRIYKCICLKIDDYLINIKPQKVVILAFDGVAPYAKIEQQRTRRYKSSFIKDTEELIKKTNTNNSTTSNCTTETTQWDQTAITPGTQFMDNLEGYLKGYYNTYNKVENASYDKLIISGPNEHGEGEHKIFDFIRKNKIYHKNTRTCIYGLDADLIMLCLNHLYISKNIFLFREKPTFHTDLDEYFDENELCFMDIHSLSSDIVRYMTNTTSKPISNIKHKTPSQTTSNKNSIITINKINDFIFVSFLLGNDFLPHFPALNIRTNGIEILLETYKNTISNNEYICTNSKINWKLFKKLIQEISNNEDRYIEHDYSILLKQEKSRNKITQMSKNHTTESKNTTESIIEYKLKQFLYYPSQNRNIEKYINPSSKSTMWINRYYESLFHFENITQDKMKSLCINYLEGLEWTYFYYKYGCIDYTWKYNYMYPPLLKDLVNYIPYFETNFFEITETPEKIISLKNTLHKYTQLSYVLPKQSLHLLPEKIKSHMEKTYPENYKQHDFYWAFSKYFWESHVDMPYINIYALQEEINKLT